ncbi:leucine-rich repeat domain-containing protein [Pseudomonas sp. NEEL19]|uniref:dermonecrotic toxin domain-containing protein n=1 Tax=Pseudomonas sp. NEEL19 TaxID=2867409 RepID=UPI00236882A5|nr:DUF6543 domain-containing protein [Pseudomonas sp. NEEL19]WDM57472.1 leucine-rich repeat domain-containing protein [Pseudomonas sp. NEEL19]
MIGNNPHHALLAAQLPHWARRANPGQWGALQASQHAPWQLQDWFDNAAPALREAVCASQNQLLHAQAALAKALKGLKQISEFAEPLLKGRLAEHGLDTPLLDTQLLRVEHDWHWLGLRHLYSHRRDSLLQAALQNFADDETFTPESAIALGSDIQVFAVEVPGTVPIGMQAPAAHFTLRSERYLVKRLPLAPQAFAALCRELDLGGAYQTHLDQQLARPETRALAVRAQQARLRLAADLAYLRHLLDGASRDEIQRLLQGHPVQCWQLALFGITLHEVMLIDAGAHGLVLHMPGHEPALHPCSDLAAVHATLATLLVEPAERQAFAAYIQQDEQAHFFDMLQQNLDAAGNTAFDRPWPRAAQADLRLTRQAITSEPFGYCHDQYLLRLKHEASLLAVPTAAADASARARRLEAWENLGWDALNAAAFFVPGVGTLMLAVTACQLLGEAVEGYEDWQAGDRQLALRHLEAIGLNLALLGGFVAAGQAVPKLFDSPLMDSLQEVRSNDGRYRLWNQDLAPYRSDVQLPADVHANAQGQYLHEGRLFIRMDRHLYEQRFDDARQQWRIVHPQAAEAWQPPLEHNTQGAWRGEHEQPGDWALETSVRRLGEAYAAFTPEQVEQAGRICGIDSEQLRQVHVEGLPPPPLLLDTLQRLNAQAAVQALGDSAPPGLFQHLYEGNSAVAPAVQQLLDTYPRLTSTLARRMLMRLNAADTATWQAHGKLPAWFGMQLRQLDSELPLVRALEGVVQPAFANDESERLLFSALDALPGWPRDLSLQLRAASPQGPLLARVGSEHAGRQSRVIKSAEGYEADLGQRPAPAKRDRDLCRAVAQALPAHARQSLGTAADGNALREHLLGWVAEHRQTLPQRLWGPRAVRPRPTGGLRGGRPLTPLAAEPRQTGSVEGAYRRIYPNASDAEIQAWLGHDEDEPLADDLSSTTQRLRDLHQRLQDLRGDLQRWVQADPARAAQRQPAVRPLVNAWRRLSTLPFAATGRMYSLELSGLGLNDEDLASLALPDDFAHIEHLSLSQNSELSHLPATLAQRFPNLRRLMLSDCRFDRVPRLPQPWQLHWLDLDSNRITWDASAQRTLDRYTRLVQLDLSDNPLISAPDLRNLAQLKTLFLSGCSLVELPQGLDQISEPFVLDLASNQFQHLPANFAVTRPVADALRLESEWLGAPVRAQIDAYNAAHQVDLLVSESDYLDFFDETGPDEAALWQRLPLPYRRDLRALLDMEPFQSQPQHARVEFWRRLAVLDADPALRQQGLMRPAQALFTLAL